MSRALLVALLASLAGACLDASQADREGVGGGEAEAPAPMALDLKPRDSCMMQCGVKYEQCAFEADTQAETDACHASYSNCLHQCDRTHPREPTVIQ